MSIAEINRVTTPSPTEPRSSFSIGSLTRHITTSQGPLIGLVLLCILFSVTSDVFLSLRNALNVVDQITVIGILSVGMTGVIIIGGIDLSVGAILGLSIMVLGWLPEQFGIPFWLAAILAIGTGALAGLVNGVLVTKAKLPAFIATLTMMSVARGLANLTTDGEQVVGFPDWFTNLASERHLGVLSVTVALFVVIAVVAGIFLHFRATGRSLYAIGGSAEVARLAGIRVKPLVIATYVASGILSAIAAITLAARLNSSQPSAGLGYELDTIAAVVIGGASLSGGVGGIGGTVVGVLIIGVLHNGLNLLGISPFIQQVVIGCVIAMAVTMDTVRRKKT